MDDYEPYSEADASPAKETGITAKLDDLDFSAGLIGESEAAKPKKTWPLPETPCGDLTMSHY